MIAQHFIRSPSLRQKLQDRYAGLELCSGLVIAIIIILSVLLISSTSGTFLFLFLLISFSLLLVFAALGYWAYEQKRRMRSSAISGPLSLQEINVMSINYRTTSPETSYIRSQPDSFYPNSTTTSKY